MYNIEFYYKGKENQKSKCIANGKIAEYTKDEAIKECIRLTKIAREMDEIAKQTIMPFYNVIESKQKTNTKN